MKASPKLIAALLRTADRIEHDPTYDWYDSRNCNCGILAQELGVPVRSIVGSWRLRAKYDYCRKTNLPITNMFKALAEYGLAKEDFAQLEYPLGHRHIACSLNDQVVRQYVAECFKSLAKDLQSQLETTITATAPVQTVEWPVTAAVNEEVPV